MHRIQSNIYWHNIQNVHDGVKSHSSYPEPEKKKKKKQFKWGKTANWCQCWDEPDVGTTLSWLKQHYKKDLNKITFKNIKKDIKVKKWLKENYRHKS